MSRPGHRMGWALAPTPGLALALSLLLAGCLDNGARPLMGLNLQLAHTAVNRDPALSSDWLALIGGREGREQVRLVRLSQGGPVPLTGLNRPDARPVSVAVDQWGERLALIRELESRSELVLYRRSLQSVQPIPIEPAGVPHRLAFSADGRVLAVEVVRGGLSQVDLLELP
ncbi:MAG: hypothetical protein NTZ53_07805 [Cyanobacteria bacterium]|nr:hypothetical protein [Cyanobacteriota bacterium]